MEGEALVGVTRLPVAVDGPFARSGPGAPTVGHPPQTRFVPAGADLQAILSLVGDGIVSVDQEGRIILFNRAAEEIFGYAQHELLGLPIEILLPAALHDTHRAEVRDFCAPVHPVRRSMGAGREVWGVRKDGVPLAVEATLSRQQIGGQRIATAVIRDVSVRRAADTQRELVSGEVAHRLRNTMAVVNSIVRLSAQGAASLEAFQSTVLGRFEAITRTNDDLIRGARSDADLATLFRAELAPFDGVVGRITIGGPDVRIGEQHAVALALVVHEMTTNAAKYGSLSVAAGRLNIGWTVEAYEDERLRVLWTESAGPAVAPPIRSGFGGSLISRSLSPYGGKVEVAFNASGVTCRIDLPLG